MCRYCQECERPACQCPKRKRGEQEACEAESPFTVGRIPFVKDWGVIPGVALPAGPDVESMLLAELLDDLEAAEATGEALKGMLQILDEHSQ